METDNKILACIDKNYKTVDEISVEIGETHHRVLIRMNKLKLRSLVYEVQGASDSRGVKPPKYKTKHI